MPRMLLAVAAGLVVLAGCGSAENDPNLAAAAQKTEDAGSSRFAVTGSAFEQGERLEIACTGEADYAAPRLRLSCDYGSAGRMDIIGLGTTTYMRGGAFGFGGSEGTWVKSRDEEESIASEISPQRLLAMLRGASRSTERIGEEQVRGVDTVRYRLVVDCEEAELVDCESGTAPVEVWVDDDGLVRRIAVDQSPSVSFAFEFFDFGAAVVIEAPAAGDVVDIDEWAAPKPCEPSAGSPLTGRDVRAAMQRQGLDPREETECFPGTVAALETGDDGVNEGGVAHCTVSRTSIHPSMTFELSGMQTEVVGNIQCAYTEKFADAMTRVLADLRRQIRQ